MGNKGKLDLILEGTASPHSFTLKPSHAKMLENADAIFWIDKDLESFLEKPLKSIPKKAKVIHLMDLSSLEIHKFREKNIYGGHDDHDDHQTKDDVHIWLSPDNAIKIINKANKVLSLYYPQNAKIYNENSKIMIDKIKKLKTELDKELAPIKDKPYVVFHDAYQYFEKAFGLNAVGSIALEGDIASSPKQVSYIKEKIVKLKASCVFQEPQFDSKLVKIVVEGTNAQIGTLDPLGVGIKDEKDFYLQLLRNMAKSLKECLG